MRGGRLARRCGRSRARYGLRQGASFRLTQCCFERDLTSRDSGCKALDVPLQSSGRYLRIVRLAPRR